MPQRIDTKKITAVGMLCAFAYVAVLLIRIPLMVPFLKYEPKDVIIALGGFIWGPLVSLITAVIVALIEMFTISDTGLWGLLMNVISSCAFACTAAAIYKKKRTIVGALIGLVTACIVMTGVMLVWNYLITPIYMDAPREQVAGMLIPVFMPFNIIKAGLNAGITFFLYKPVITALRKARLVPSSGQTATGSKGSKIGVYILFGIITVTCVLFILSYNKVI